MIDAKVEPQGHEPTGAPNGTGGQWSEKDNAHPEVTVAENATGSFLFPPSEYGSVDEFLEFWQAVPISDRVLSNLVMTYSARREEWIGDELEVWGKKYDADPEHRAWASAKGRTPHEIELKFEQSRTDEIHRLSAKRPEGIGAMNARKVAIAARMHDTCGVFDEEARQRVLSHQFTFASGSEFTVKEIYERYNLHEITRVALVDTDASVTRQLEELRKHIGAYSHL